VPPITTGIGGSARIGWAGITRGQVRVLCYQYAGESSSGLQADGSPENWRCIALEKLGGVQLLEGSWHTAPNHSRPQTCIVEVDVDAED